MTCQFPETASGIQAVIASLDPYEIYTPDSTIHWAAASGYFSEIPEVQRDERCQLRLAMDHVFQSQPGKPSEVYGWALQGLARAPGAFHGTGGDDGAFISCGKIQGQEAELVKVKRISSRIRYRMLLKILDPMWLYTAATITDFAGVNQLLDHLTPEEIPLARKSHRLRIAMGRHRKRLSLPELGDGLTRLTLVGRPFVSWLGWRWQEYGSRLLAEMAWQALLDGLWPQLSKKGFYGIGDLLGIMKDMGTGGLPSIYNRLLLRSHAQKRGLDIGKGYLGEVWMGSPPPAEFCDLLTRGVNLLTEHIVYTIADIVRTCDAKPSSACRRWRLALYQLAAWAGFPASGDAIRLDEVSQPGWSGGRWQGALEKWMGQRPGSLGGSLP